MGDLAALTAVVEAGDRSTATTLGQQAVDDGMDASPILASMTTTMVGVDGAKRPAAS